MLKWFNEKKAEVLKSVKHIPLLNVALPLHT